MVTREEKQANRKKAMRELYKLLRMAYNGLTYGEFEILKAAYEYIDMKQRLENNNDKK